MLTKKIGAGADLTVYCAVESIALLRLDGDLYQSTYEVLRGVYHKVESMCLCSRHLSQREREREREGEREHMSLTYTLSLSLSFFLLVCQRFMTRKILSDLVFTGFHRGIGNRRRLEAGRYASSRSSH
jgi:hypothetical protein